VAGEPSSAVALGRRDGASSASARLGHKIDLVSGPLALACERLFLHPRLTELLPTYLVRTHTIIRATVPLMEAAAKRARTLAGRDPVADGLARYLARHIEEEQHHDEWLLEDLELLGVERSTVRARVPSPTVASLVGSQYYWALHYHPVAILGYISVMEGFPPSPQLIDHLIAATGHPPAAFRTLAEHGDLDPHHRDELAQAIDALPLAREHEIVLGLSAMTSVDSLARSIEEVLEAAV
jgi:hypothetical protein